MKTLFLILALCTFPAAWGQRERQVLRFYSQAATSEDTIYAFSIVQSQQGYRIVFPETTEIYYVLKDSVAMRYDTIFEKTRSEFGPYVFKRKKRKIMFKNLSQDKKWWDLYSLSKGQKFLAPDLFSSSTDAYNSVTALISTNDTVQVENNSFICYTFLQTAVEGKKYTIIFIDQNVSFPIFRATHN